MLLAGVPDAERAAVTFTAPVVALLGVKFINVLSVVVTLSTPVFDIVKVFGLAAAAAKPIPELDTKLSTSSLTVSIAVPPLA